MEYKVLSRCPVCGSRMTVTSIKCSKCQTVIENNFTLSKFEYLDAEQLEFIELFLKSRGNIKDVEKELGISYPTVRAKLDDVIAALGYTVSKKPAVSNEDILESLEKGEITADQAVNMLKDQ